MLSGNTFGCLRGTFQKISSVFTFCRTSVVVTIPRKRNSCLISLGRDRHRFGVSLTIVRAVREILKRFRKTKLPPEYYPPLFFRKMLRVIQNKHDQSQYYFCSSPHITEWGAKNTLPGILSGNSSTASLQLRFRS